MFSLRVKLKNTCGVKDSVPNVQLALLLPPGVEVVSVGSQKNGHDKSRDGKKNHTRLLYEAGGRLPLGRDDHSGPHTLQGRRAMRRTGAHPPLQRRGQGGQDPLRSGGRDAGHCGLAAHAGIDTGGGVVDDDDEGACSLPAWTSRLIVTTTINHPWISPPHCTPR